MPTGRLGITAEGIGYEAIEQFADASTINYSATTVGGSTAIGLAVTLSGNDTIALCADGDPILGKLLKVEVDGLCTVQTGGFTTLPGGSSATLTRGSAIVGALGASNAKGYIRSAASGTAAELIKCRHSILNNADTTNVMVSLRG